MRSSYLIAVCDILGFSELVQRRSLDSVVDKTLASVRKALSHSLLGDPYPASPPPMRELDGNPHVSVALFSDTILLYTKHNTDEAVGELLQVMGWLLFETIVDDIWIRAGIASGEAHMDPDNSIYVGKPIIEAYRLEQSQQWAGAALAHSACARLAAACGRSGDVARWWVTPWDVPLKVGSMPTLAVNWNRCTHERESYDRKWCTEMS